MLSWLDVEMLSLIASLLTVMPNAGFAWATPSQKAKEFKSIFKNVGALYSYYPNVFGGFSWALLFSSLSGWLKASPALLVQNV